MGKTLLEGTQVSIVRCEKVVISGSFFRNKLRMRSFLKKRMNTNPTRGPFHQRAPAKLLYKAVRGMLPIKTKRGRAALARLETYEGIPHHYQKKKRMIAAAGDRRARLSAERRFTTLERISEEHGWSYKDIVTQLEAKREAKAKEWHAAGKPGN